MRTANSSPLLELVGVERVFSTVPPTIALRPLDLEVFAGDYIALTGPSGGGKSTALNIIGLLDTPSSGTYRLAGADTGSFSEAERNRQRGSEFGFVFQEYYLLKGRTALENVALGERYSVGPLLPGWKVRAESALRRVGLSDRVDAYAETLSGGERQRVAVARAIVSKPTILLADEPTGSLDEQSSSAVVSLLESLVADGTTLVVVTHDLELASRASRSVEIRR